MSRSRPGPPLTLRCSRCKKGENYRISDRLSNQGLRRTGRTRGTSWDGSPKFVEVCHQHCGHLMWSTHPTAKRLPSL